MLLNSVRNFIRNTAVVCAVLLSACTAQSKPVVGCLQPSNGPVVMHGCSISILISTKTDPVANVAHQASTPGEMILSVGRKEQRDWTIQNFSTLIAESKKYPGKFTWVHLYDEIGWCPGSGICWFMDEDVVAQGAAIARANGMKTVATIMPEVILDPRFQLRDINMLDGISIDVYPSVKPNIPVDFRGCKFNGNASADLFYCAGQKLRAMGFVGQLGLIYQGFGMTFDTHDQRMQYLLEQRKAIDNAQAMGADAVMAFGCHLGKEELQAEPVLVPLCGTQYEWLVRP